MKLSIGDEVIGINSDINGCICRIEEIRNGEQSLRILKLGTESWQTEEWGYKEGDILKNGKNGLIKWVNWEKCVKLHKIINWKKRLGK